MLVAMPDLHKAMQGAGIADQVAQWMVDVSGLPLDMLGKLYRASITPAEQEVAPGIDSHNAIDDVDAEEAGQGADAVRERSARH
jgi:hypothetical protein